MRIAISINTAWNIFNFRQGLISRLLAEGHDIVAIAPVDDYSTRLVDLGCQFEPIHMEATGANPVADLQLILKYRKVFKKVKPDIILQYTIKPNIYGTLAANTLGIPVINNVSGLGTVFLNTGIVSKIARVLYRVAFKRVDLTFFQNKDDEADFKEAVGMPNLKCRQLPGSGVNLQRFTPATKEVDKTDFTFLMISRLISDKGVYEYIEAAKHIVNDTNLKGVHFQLIGKLDEEHTKSITKEELSDWIDSGIVQYLDETAKIEDIISKVDCVVLPSYREGTPKTLLEAGAMARPLVTTDVPGCRNVVKDGYNGFFCQVKDASDLERAIRQLLSLSEQEISTMGLNSRQFVEEFFDENIVISKYITAINELTEGKAVDE